MTYLCNQCGFRIELVNTGGEDMLACSDGCPVGSIYLDAASDGDYPESWETR